MFQHTRNLVAIALLVLFSSLQACNNGDDESTDASRFVSEESSRDILANLVAMTPVILDELRQVGMREDAQLKLEFYFYSDTVSKTLALATALRELGYEAESGPSDTEDELFDVEGWTSPIEMNEDAVVAWTEKMVRLGYDHDCVFDGWSTSPEQ